MSSRSSRPGKRENCMREDEQYILVISEVSSNFQWQDFKDAVRQAGAKHVRRVHVESIKPDNILMGQCEIRDWENALRVYDIFLAEGLHGHPIRLSLGYKTGENGFFRLKGPEASRNRVTSRTLTRQAPVVDATMAPKASGRCYRPTPGITEMVAPVVGPPASSLHGSMVSRRASRTQSNHPVSVRTYPPRRNNPSGSKNACVTFRNLADNVKISDLERLLQKLNVFPTHKFVDGESFKATFSNLAIAQHTCQHLNGQSVRGRVLQVTVDQEAAEKSSKPETHPRRASQFRPEAPAFVPCNSAPQTERPLIVNGSGGSFKRPRYVSYSDDEED